MTTSNSLPPIGVNSNYCFIIICIALNVISQRGLIISELNHLRGFYFQLEQKHIEETYLCNGINA